MYALGGRRVGDRRAESGRRYVGVAGVPTCALQSWWPPLGTIAVLRRSPKGWRPVIESWRIQMLYRLRRSEERRVGKECRSLGWKRQQMSKYSAIARPPLMPQHSTPQPSPALDPTST